LRHYSLLPAPDYGSVVLRIVKCFDIARVPVICGTGNYHSDIRKKTLWIWLERLDSCLDDRAGHVSAVLEDEAQIAIQDFNSAVVAAVEGDSIKSRIASEPPIV